MMGTAARRVFLGFAAVFFLSLCSQPPGLAAAPEGLEGIFEAELQGSRLQLNLQIGRSTQGRQLPVRAFHARPDGVVELRREAGVFLLSGLDLKARGRQRGEVVFVPDAAYLAGLEARGLGEPSAELSLSLATCDVTLAFLDGLLELGYSEPLSRYLEMRIHDVDARYVRQLEAAGLARPPAGRLIAMAIHGVDGRYLEALGATGFTTLKPSVLSPQRLVAMRIHGVEAAWVSDLAELGYRDLPARRLVEMRIHGVDPPWLRGLAGLGYRNLEPEQIVALRIHGVDAEWIEGLGESGADLTVGQLIERRIHGR
ncbi:MAG: hypothetical protein AAF725_05145 [Acidobacteriota bacterium]